MMKRILPVLLFLFSSPFLFAQQYTDYIGAGHQIGIQVTTSHNQNANQTGTKSIDGFPVEDVTLLKDASRFLAQSTMGYDYEMIQLVAAMGYEAWLDEQFSLPRLDPTDAVIHIEELLGGDPGEFYGMFQFRAAWWNLVLQNPDYLRQRINYALSQIFVVSSFGSDLFEDVGRLSSGYYNVLSENAFGNYRNLLSEVSRNPSMGLYLSHMNNPKSDPANNIHPDENYAREVMQLFSIGLYELNNDGTRKQDSAGNPIPTYNNDDIREFAKVFTGFGDGAPGGTWNTEFEDPGISALVPMKMYEEWHEPGPKTLLNGQLIPAGQTGLQDFNAAMDNLYHHPNTGPFISKALIQFLVTSNPSPAYVNRVATVFNDNGSGVRGDFKSVIKTILLDAEARNCQPLDQPTSGKLREPMIRYTGFLRAFNARASEGVFIDVMEKWQRQTGQIPMYSPSVFNFYQPEFQPNGPIANQDLVAPVFQIHNSSSSIGFINEANDWLFGDQPFEPIDQEFLDEINLTIDLSVLLDFSDELLVIDDPANLVDRLDILLACGQMSAGTKSIIASAITQVSDPEERLDLAVYLIMISPDYAVLK